MPTKKTLAYLGTVPVLATGVWELNRSNPTPPPPDDSPLLALDDSRVAALVLETPGTPPLRVERRDNHWVLPAAASFPVDFTRFRGFVRSIMDLKAGSTVFGGEQLLEELGLREGEATVLRFLAEDGEELGVLQLGAERMNQAQGYADGRYARVGGGPVRLLSEAPRGLPTGPLPWVDTTLLGLGPDTLGSLVLTHADGEEVRPEMDGLWSLSTLRFQDVRTAGEDFSPTVTATLTAKDEAYRVVLRLGPPNEQGLAPVRYQVEGGEEQEKANQLRARQNWEYLVRDEDLGRLRQRNPPETAGESGEASEAE